MRQLSHLVALLLALDVVYISGHQNVPPGVPPQTYQQHVPQMQQVPVQHMPVQHIPVQQIPMQQVPVQQQYVQQMPQQHMVQPGQQNFHGHHHEGQPQVLNVANIQHEKQHIAEHLAVPMDTNKMTEQELQFHYFKIHDSDNNNKLDGCELIKSLIHWHEQGQGEPGKPAGGEKLFKDEELVALIDPILALDDANSDGYIDYPEFVRAQQKAAAAAQQQQTH